MSEASEAAAARIRETDSVTLINEVLTRVEPILTHKRKPSLMSIPPNFESDDDVYVCDRLLELRRRLSSTGEE